ncbi:hypothetical protein M2H05_09760 [Vibrio vulnificus]|nr:hypothetical protein [Vibrio vulnificus]MCU8218754.1 hypothetical protein [Vibrio vulnificus]
MKVPALLLLCMLAVGAAKASGWEVNESKDKMTGKVLSYRASSDWVETNNPVFMSSNKQMYSWVNVSCNKSKQWAFIAFTQNPFMGSGDTIQREIVTRVKFDNHLSDITIYNGDTHSQVVFVDDATSFIKMLRSSNTMKLEFPWYQHGNIYLDYDLSGSNSAIASALSKCNALN